MASVSEGTRLTTRVTRSGTPTVRPVSSTCSAMPPVCPPAPTRASGTLPGTVGPYFLEQGDDMDRWASGIDTAWLQLEQETNRMVVHGLLFCDGPVDLDALRARVRERWVEVYPGLRQRPTWPTGSVGLARWVDAPPDLDAHVTTMTLPEPGDDAALADRIGALMSRPLPDDGPWWRMELVTGVPPGRGGCIQRDPRRDPPRARRRGRAQPPLPRPVRPGVRPRHTRRLFGLAASVHGGARPAPHGPHARRARRVAVGHRAAGRHRRGRRRARRHRPGRPLVGGAADQPTAGEAVGAAGPPGRREGRPVDLRRRPGRGSRAAGKQHGGTMNDVLCAGIAGALRDFLGEDVPRLRAVMPSNLRPLDQPISDELGNEFGLVLPPMPTDEPDPARRVERMHRAMATIKRTTQSLASFSGIAAAGLGTPSHTQDLVARYARAGSLIISNVPGPLEELTIGETRVRDVMFWVPCSGRLGLGVSVPVLRRAGAARGERRPRPHRRPGRHPTASPRRSAPSWPLSPPGDYILRRYWPPTSKNASVSWPSEHTRAAAISSAKTLPPPVATSCSRRTASAASAAWRVWKSARAVEL